jgi:hypothetical protein
VQDSDRSFIQMQLFTCAGTEAAMLKKDWDAMADMYRELYREGVLKEEAMPVGVQVADAGGVAAKQVRRVLTSAIWLAIVYACTVCGSASIGIGYLFCPRVRVHWLRPAVSFTPFLFEPVARR